MDKALKTASGATYSDYITLTDKKHCKKHKKTIFGFEIQTWIFNV
jgi:hypothetical protein